MNKKLKASVKDISQPSERLTHFEPTDLKPLPKPYENLDELPKWNELDDQPVTELLEEGGQVWQRYVV